MRILLFTGKGGVGKTTAAAATALRAARSGLRTLVISTDPAHSLSDALDMPLGPEPVPVIENLWGQELDVYFSMKKYWENMRQLMYTVFRWQGMRNVVAEELSVLPGMEEASAFLWIDKYFAEGFYDLIVIDSAPTGETLTLLTLPQVTRSWLTRAFPGQKFAIKTLGSVVRRTTGVPLDRGYEELERLFDKLERIQKAMLDPDICSIRLVANPERMVVQEAKRAYTYLQLYGYNVDAVIVNRVWPDELGAAGQLFAKYLASQKAHLLDIRESFDHLPVLQVPHLGEEVFGLKLLERIGSTLYARHEVADVYYREKPIVVEEVEGGYEVRMRLPFIKKSEFSLQKFGDELVIDLGNRRKNVFLPRFASFMEMTGHSFEAPWLTVQLSR